MQITAEQNAFGSGFPAFDQRLVNDPPYRVGFGQTAAEAILDLLTVCADDVRCHAGCRKHKRTDS
jgi:hypothetical protein